MQKKNITGMDYEGIRGEHLCNSRDININMNIMTNIGQERREVNNSTVTVTGIFIVLSKKEKV